MTDGRNARSVKERIRAGIVEPLPTSILDDKSCGKKAVATSVLVNNIERLRASPKESVESAADGITRASATEHGISRILSRDNNRRITDWSVSNMHSRTNSSSSPRWRHIQRRRHDSPWVRHNNHRRDLRALRCWWKIRRCSLMGNSRLYWRRRR